MEEPWQSLEKREKKPALVPNMSVLSQQAVIQSPSSHTNDVAKKKND
jgi:hypothetical protein